MTADESPEIVETPPGASLRDYPWRWGQVLVGFAPILMAYASLSLLGPAARDALPAWSWIPITGLLMGWMLAYPLRVVRRGPAFPGPRAAPVELAIAAIAVPVVLLIFAGVQLLVSGLPGVRESANPFEPIAGSTDSYNPSALVVLAALVAPVAEEVFFRGMLYNALRRRMPAVLAALLQGAVFAAMHPFGLAERAGIASIGFCLAMLYEWRKTLAAPIFLHALINALAMAMLFASVAVAARAPVLGVRGDAREKGCVLTEVKPGGAAAEAGLVVGDVITGAGENSVRDQRDLVLILRTKKVGDRIPVWYLRAGEPGQVEAVLKGRAK